VRWELLLSMASTAGALVLAFLYARARAKAALVDQLRTIANHLADAAKAQRTVIAGKEEYIRELEKTVLGSLPAGKLADRLNRLFAGNRSRAADPVPPTKPAPRAAGD
jgi:ParB-like chromosome segregation protein Spo0J